MKLILALCAVISLAVAFPAQEDFDDFDVNVFDVRLPISDDQLKCIQDGLQKVVDANPELSWWFDDMNVTVAKLLEGGKKCDSLSGIEQKRCYLKLKIVAQYEYRRLLKLLPADHKEVADQLRKIVEECMES